MTQWLVSQISTPIWLTNTTSTTTINYLSVGSVTEPERHHPMSIGTMAELETIPIGKVVRIDDRDWTRTEKGLAREGADLDLSHFTGAIKRGAVRDMHDEPPAAGEWWEGTSRIYYILRVDESRVWHTTLRRDTGAVYNRQGNSRIHAWVGNATLSRLSGAPAIIANQPGRVDDIVAYGELLAQYTDSQEAVRLATDRLRRMEEKSTVNATNRRRVLAAITNIRNNLAIIERIFEE